MKVILVRVGIDSGEKSGGWNAPVNSNNEFAYVPILEDEGRGKGIRKKKPFRPGYKTTYKEFKTQCEKFGEEHELTPKSDCCHLDPDFRYLTYGDEGRKGKQLENLKLVKNDILAFYAGLKPPNAGPGKLVQALIGLYRLADTPKKALCISHPDWCKNAHTRREPEKDDIVFSGMPNVSGRLERCIPIGEYNASKRGYYLARDIQEKWGEPNPIYLFGFHHELCHPEEFDKWFKSQNVKLKESNN